jgi:AcrR family transcriptional regulator
MADGLRHRKKQRQHQAILGAAIEFAHSHGYETMRVRDLIAGLEISEATFFNYFPSKAALLDAWLEDELANAFARPTDDTRVLRASLRARIRHLAESARSDEALGFVAWRRARIQLATRAAAPRAEIAGELEVARDAGDLRRDIEPNVLAEWLVGAVAFAVSSALASERDCVAAALSAADLILDGARRRHERVRVGGPAAEPRR